MSKFDEKKKKTIENLLFFLWNILEYIQERFHNYSSIYSSEFPIFSIPNNFCILSKISSVIWSGFLSTKRGVTSSFVDRYFWYK